MQIRTWHTEAVIRAMYKIYYLCTVRSQRAHPKTRRNRWL